MKLKLFVILLIVILLSLSFVFYLRYKDLRLTFENRRNKLKDVIALIKKEKIPLPKYQFGVLPSYLDASFFEKVKKSLENKKLDFILVNLDSKKLFFYKKGHLERTFNVLTIGKIGSFWETPAGFYEIESKSKKAFSSIGHVYMPYSMEFQGNFFIHGWPYYPNGIPVSSKFSGGCIRMATKDAAILFKLVNIGTPVLVVKNQFNRENSTYKLKYPKISAKAFLAADLKNNFIFSELSSSSTYPVASITKLITALTATEYINLWKTITFKETDQIFTSLPRLKIGEKYTAFDLLYPLLTESSNEAALTIADFLGRKRFVLSMNEKSRSIGMINSRFVDPYGGSGDDRASLDDLFQLGRYLYFNRKFILNITKGKNYDYLISKKFSNLKNFNCFIEDKDFIGGKIGKTYIAGETMLAIFNIDFNNQKRPIFITVLNSEDACSDVRVLKDWIKTSFNFEEWQKIN